MPQLSGLNVQNPVNSTAELTPFRPVRCGRGAALGPGHLRAVRLQPEMPAQRSGRSASAPSFTSASSRVLHGLPIRRYCAPPMGHIGGTNSATGGHPGHVFVSDVVRPSHRIRSACRDLAAVNFWDDTEHPVGRDPRGPTSGHPTQWFAIEDEYAHVVSEVAPECLVPGGASPFDSGRYSITSPCLLIRPPRRQHISYSSSTLTVVPSQLSFGSRASRAPRQLPPPSPRRNSAECALGRPASDGLRVRRPLHPPQRT
jgi:hypothetical protein